MKLTATNIPTLGPGEHTDGSLILRVRPSGARSWCVRYRFQGRDLRYTLGKVKLKDTDKGLTLKEAGDACKILLGRVARGEDPQTEKIRERHNPKPKTVTVKDVMDEGLEHIRLRDISRDEYTRIVERDILPAFQSGRLDATLVSRRDVRAWSEKIAKHAPYMANRAFCVFRRLWSIAQDRELLEHTPFLSLRKPAKETPRDRYLSLAELWALRQAMLISDHEDPQERMENDAIRLLMLTGVRRSNVLGAHAGEFEHLDTPNALWILPPARMKANRQHLVPLIPQAVTIIKHRLEQSGPALFKSRKNMLEDRFMGRLTRQMTVLLGEEVPNWRIHDIRRTYATQMTEHLKVSRPVISALLAHLYTEGAKATHVYERAIRMVERRKALEDWADFWEHLPEPGKILAWAKAGDVPGADS